MTFYGVDVAPAVFHNRDGLTETDSRLKNQAHLETVLGEAEGIVNKALNSSKGPA
jgi:hypothetical protein